MDFIDLRAQYTRLEKRIQARLRNVMSTGSFINGPEVEELEKTLASWVGTAHCVSCANGTDALHLALLDLDVGPGDAVLTTSFTFAATAEMVALRGATPVFVDVDPITFNLSVAGVETALSEVRRKGQLRPRGIIAVDLFGLPADYESLGALARRDGLFIVQDAAQSFGGSLNGKRAPGLADIGTTSFFPAKPLGCYGDGGALFTNDEAQAERLRSLRSHGKGSHKYEHTRIGLNSRLDTIQAAILLEKFRVFPEELSLRQEIASRYTASLRGCVQVPSVPESYTSAWAQYSIRHEDRDRIRRELAMAGIPAVIYYPQPLHLQPCYAQLGYRKGDLPVCEQLAEQIFSLPMSPYLKRLDQDRVIAAVQYAAAQTTLESSGKR